MVRKCKMFCHRKGRPSSLGFTLVEILASLVVMSVAITVFISLFSASLSISQSSRSRKVAGSLAEEVMERTLNGVGQADWTKLDGAAAGELIRVEPANDDDGPSPVEPPSTKPTTEKSDLRESDMFGRYGYEVYGKVLSEGAKHVEVTVVISWKERERGRPEMVTLTSAMPRSAAEGVS